MHLSLTPAENNLKIMILLLLLATGLVFGCIVKKGQKPPDANAILTGQKPQGLDENKYKIPEDDKPFVPRQYAEPDTNTQVLTRPYYCNDIIIQNEMKKIFGKEYDLAKEAIKPGVNYASAKCYLRNGAKVALFFSIVEEPENSYALDAIESEKSQWFGRSENPKSEDQNFGTKAYLLSEKDSNGDTYKLVFIDDTNKKVYVEITAANGQQKEKIIQAGKILNKLI